MATYLSHGGQSAQRSARRDNELVVATVDGVSFLSRAADGRWKEDRRELTGTHVSALVRDPVSGTLFAGTHGQGLYASAGGGRTWERRSEGLVSQHIYSMNCVQAGAETRVYAGTEPANLSVSTDSGKTWTLLPKLREQPMVDTWRFPAPPHDAHLKNVGFDPRTPSTIYASVEVGALLKSTDAGATWRLLPVPYEDVHRVAIHDSAPDHVYVSTGKGIYHSRDAGEAWEQLTDQSMRVGYPDALIIHPDQPELLFTAGAIVWPRDWPKYQTADSRIARSRDGGRTWQVTDRGLPEHIHGNIEAMALNVWQGGYALYAGTTDGEIFTSDDGGDTWSSMITGLPAISKTSHHTLLASFKGGPAMGPIKLGV